MMVSFLKYVMILHTLMNNVWAMTSDGNHIIQSITHWNIPSNHYVCLCTPSHIAKEDYTLNASNWDNVCSNLQVCSWNKHEVLVRTWYHNN